MDDGDRMFGTNTGGFGPAESRDGRRAPDERRAKHRVFLPGNPKKKAASKKRWPRFGMAPETALIESARARAVSEEVRFDFRRGTGGVFASPVGRAFGARDVYFEDGEGASTTEVSPPSHDIFKKRKLLFGIARIVANSREAWKEKQSGSGIAILSALVVPSDCTAVAKLEQSQR